MGLSFTSSLPLAPTTSFQTQSINRCKFHPLTRFQTKKNCRTIQFPTMVIDVLVTGAGGRTGSIVFNLLSKDPSNFKVTGLLRNIEKSTTTNPYLTGKENYLIEGDITVPETLLPAMKGKDALVILTSAVPKMEPPPEGEQRDPKQPPSMYYEAGGMPEDIDWKGARSQIDLAKSLNLSHVVLVGSMGSTEENNMLNKIGNGNILKFKRKAQLYLQDAGIPYTIINPGGLLNELPSQRELVIGEKDELFSIFNRMECGIPRGDIARVVVSALATPSAKNKVLDIVAKPKGHGKATVDPSELFEHASARL